MIINKFNSEKKDLERKIEEFVQKHPEGNYFQSISAFNLFKTSKNYTPLLLYAEINGEIKGVLLAIRHANGKHIKKLISMRTIIIGGPLVLDSNDTNYIVELLLKRLKELSKNSSYIEFRNLNDMSYYKEAFTKEKFSYLEHLNYIVPISDEDKNLKRLSRSKKRQVRKSLKNNVQIIENPTINQVIKFYEILQELYTKKIKKPLPSFDLFENFYKSNYGAFFLIEYKREILGGIMCPIYKDTIYEWYIAGLDGKYKNIYPSVMATWAPIQYGNKTGLNYFDFMGAGKPNDDYGVREFKEKFGGDLVSFGRYLKINKPLFYWLGVLYLKLKSSFNEK